MEEQKRIYRYYDKINCKYVRVEVTDEVLEERKDKFIKDM